MVNSGRKRSIVYVDGLNLYYGALKGTSYKWLDLQGLFRRLRPDDDIQEIAYFSAEVMGTDAGDRQRVYLRVLEALPRVNVILGRFKHTQTLCNVAGCTYPGSRTFQKPEEKRTDVNIAIRIVADAYQDRCDRFVLVSGDSDLVPPLRFIRSEFPSKEIVVYIPARVRHRGAAMELRGEAHKHRQLPMNVIAKSQLPTRVPDGAGGYLTKPASW